MTADDDIAVTLTRADLLALLESGHTIGPHHRASECLICWASDRAEELEWADQDEMEAADWLDQLEGDTDV